MKPQDRVLRKIILSAIRKEFRKSNEGYFDGEHLCKKVSFEELTEAILNNLLEYFARV